MVEASGNPGAIMIDAPGCSVITQFCQLQVKIAAVNGEGQESPTDMTQSVWAAASITPSGSPDQHDIA